jgi:hypothetical protein
METGIHLILILIQIVMLMLILILIVGILILILGILMLILGILILTRKEDDIYIKFFMLFIINNNRNRLYMILIEIGFVLLLIEIGFIEYS